MTGAGEELVERKLGEYFTGPDLVRAAEALSMLDDGRVQLAAIKLADGDVESLERYVLLAEIDWRDVIGPAEHPGYLAAGPEAGKRPDAARLVEADLEQYEEWLRRPGPFGGAS